ncbi:MAG: flagellar filament capping protein FliD [Parasphingorhabdus sp.]|nr:flagellar filament capping protein FliD [Parasphingorhabdus sp.]
MSSLGIRTERDGTLTLDSTRLDAIIAADPDAVGELLDPAIPSATQPGISGILNDIRDRLKASDGPLEISQKRYNAAREDLVRLRSRLDEDSARYETQLQQTYARMDGRLAALQATQAYLTQQIAAWNSTNG